jgi:hypothetical protein
MNRLMQRAPSLSRLRALVSERPLLVLSGAVLAGYLVGRLLARR